MLEQICLRNFKALQNATIDLKTITVLIGANGTGKSSVLQALAVLKQSREQQGLHMTGEYMSLGEYQDVVHKREKDREIHVRMVTRFREPLKPLFRRRLRFIYEAIFDQKRMSSQRGNIEEHRKRLFEAQYFAQPVEMLSAEPRSFIDGEATFGIDGNSTVALPLRIVNRSLSSDSDETRFRFQEASKCLSKAFSAINDTLVSSYYVPAIRGFMQPSYILTEQSSEDFSTASDADLQAQNVASTLSYRRDIEDKVSNWAKRIIGTRIEAKLIPPRRVAVEAIVGSHRMNMVNEGFGTNQLVHPLLQLAVAPPDSLVSIEEPEIHVHPAAQTRLCELLIDVAKRERKQIMITTHSEHIVNSMLTCVARRELKANELAVYFFERQRDKAKASRLSVDDKGRLEGGLKGFAEANLDELEKYMKALTREETT